MKTKQCTGCEEDKSFDQFYKNKNLKDGHSSRCKICMRVAYNSSRRKRSAHYNQVQRKRIQATVIKWRLWKQEKGCIICQETFAPCLQLHHLDPTDKEDAISNMASRGTAWNKIMVEASKGVIVCGNCHVKVHEGCINITEYLGV